MAISNNLSNTVVLTRADLQQAIIDFLEKNNIQGNINSPSSITFEDTTGFLNITSTNTAVTVVIPVT